MRRIGRRAAVIAVTAILGLGVLGTAAFAAFAPAPTDTFSLVPPLPGSTVAEAPKGTDKIKAVLDALVSKGVITQAQEDAILAALKDAAGDRERAEFLKRVFANLFEQSATYLGMPPAELKAKLPGTSLAAIANATPGKSRDGVNDAIAKALADGKITQEQADKAKAAAPQHIAQFVDHTYPKREPRPTKAPSPAAFLGNVLATSSDYLGIPQRDLITQLRTGTSLGQIANSTAGKSRDGLVSALTNAANARIDEAQKSGHLTPDQAAKLKAGLAEAIAKAVDLKGGGVKSR
jgi:polyhydroxyalkanoate synthesis regulator phasin